MAVAPFTLGITGGIGSGKSAVSRLLASYCLAPLVDVDQCCKTLLDVGEPGWVALRKNFGEQFLLANREVDRVKLREKLFGDHDFRRHLDSLLHPLAQDLMMQRVQQLGGNLVLVEIPLLYEAGWQHVVDAVLVVFARRGCQCCRIMHRDQVSRLQAARAIRSQMDLGKKARLADYCIDNSGAWQQTRVEVIRLGDALSERFAGSF